MQTFLPYDSFKRSAEVLDNARLGKQRVETLQIVSVLTNRTTAWQNHPAVNMWRGCLDVLHDYHAAIVSEWRSRGFKDTTMDRVACMILGARKEARTRVPFWLSFTLFHQCHRWNLAYKDASLYPHEFASEMPAKEKPPYVWPKPGFMLRKDYEAPEHRGSLLSRCEPLLMLGKVPWDAVLLDPTGMPSAFGRQLHGFGLLSHCMESRQKDGKAVIYLAERRF